MNSPFNVFSLKKPFQLINIYALTNPSPRKKFQKNMKNYTKTQNNLILAVGFNMVEDLLLDGQS